MFANFITSLYNSSIIEVRFSIDGIKQKPIKFENKIRKGQ